MCTIEKNKSCFWRRHLEPWNVLKSGKKQRKRGTDEKSRKTLKGFCRKVVLERERERNSATRWLYYFSIFGQLEQWKFAQNYEIFANVGWQFCQIHLIFFAKQFISIHINGTQKIQKTNHYILLTNVSIKRCIKCN